MGYVSGAMSGMSTGGISSAPANPFQAFIQPYMNNPYHMNMQKCMDNDACTAWVTHQMYQGFSKGASSGAGNTASTVDAAPQATDGTATDASAGDSTATQSSGTAAKTVPTGTAYSPAMVGFPPGFQPAFYGLDYDALPVDCMDDSKCARGLMMYTSGRNLGGPFGNLFSQMFMKSRLQKPRRLSRPRYGVPYRYGRQY